MPRRFVRFCTCSLVLAVIPGCANLNPNLLDTTRTIQAPTSVTEAKFIPGLPKGYECPLVPNGFDPAGSIYRLDKNGTYFRVKDFRDDPVVARGRKTDVRIANYVLSDKQKTTAALSFNLLQKALPGLTADASADFNKEISVDVTVKDIMGEVIYDDAADYIVEWFKTNVKARRGSKYFLVRETIRAGSVGYKLRQKDLAKLGGKAQLQEIAKTKADVTIRDKDGSLNIEQTFSPRIPVCIKSAEIVVEGAGSHGALPLVNVSLKSADDTKQPVIKRVGRD